MHIHSQRCIENVFSSLKLKLGVITRAYSPSIWELRQLSETLSFKKNH